MGYLGECEIERKVSSAKANATLQLHQREFTGDELVKTKAQNEKGSSELEPFIFLVGRAGLEPATNGLKVRCSTN
jgi:hypothetical protein